MRKLTATLDLDSGRFVVGLQQAGQKVQQFSSHIKGLDSALGTTGAGMKRFERSVHGPVQSLRDWVIIIGQARSALLTLNDISFGLVGSFVKQAAEIERLKILMKGLSNAQGDLAKSADATKSLAALFRIANQSGFEVKTLTDAFVKLKSAGLDPLDGSLKGLTNAVAAFGGSSETMHRASIAIQQMSGKGVISMEELRQQLGEAVPSAMQDMANATGVTMAELSQKVKTGTVEAKSALSLMFLEFDRKYSGAGENLAKSMFGQIEIIKTTIAQLSTEFVSLGSTEGLYANLVERLGQINTLLKGTDGREFVAGLGDGISKVVDGMASVVEMVVKFREEIGTAIQIAAVGFGLTLGRRTLGAFVNTMRDARNGVGNFMSMFNAAPAAAAKQDALTMATAKTRAEIVAVKQADIQRAEAARFATIAAENEAGARVAALRQERAQLAQNVALAEKQRAESLAAIAAMQASRAAGFGTLGAGANVAEAERANQALKSQIAYKRALIATDAQLAAAERALAVAAAQADAAFVAETTAVAALTRTEQVAAVATTLLGTAMKGLGAAVNLALGPVGLIAFGLYEAANAAGLFETRADRATAAAERMRQGIMNASDAQAIATQRKALLDENAELEALLKSGKPVSKTDPTSKAYNSGQKYVTNPLFGGTMSIEQQNEIKANIAKNNALLKGYSDARIAGQNAADDLFISQSMENLERGTTKLKAQQSNIYKDRLAAIDKARKDGKITDAQRDSQINEVQQTRDLTVLAKYDAQVNSVRQQAATAILKYGATVKDKWDIVIAQTQERRDAFYNMISQERGLNLIDNGKKGPKGPKTDAEKMDDFNLSRYRSTYEQVAKMKALLRGVGDDEAGYLAALEARKLKSGEVTVAMVQDITRQKDALEVLVRVTREAPKDLERIDEQLSKMGINIGQAGDAAQEMADWIKNGAQEGTRRTLELTARFQNVLDPILQIKESWESAFADATKSGNTEALQIIQAELDKINGKLAQARGMLPSLIAKVDGKDALNDFNDASKYQQEWEYSMRGVDAVRTFNHAKELQRFDEIEQRIRAAGVMDEQMALRVAAVRDSIEQRQKLENLGPIGSKLTEMADQMGNIKELGATALDGFSDALLGGAESMKQFTKTMLKQLLAIILRAVIAKAILSALGLGAGGGGTGGTTLDAGSTGSLTDFSVNMPLMDVPQFHTGGIAGGSAAMRVASAAMFTNAPRYHKGTFPNLKPDEIPAVLRKNEGVFTAEQMAAMGGNGGMTPVQVNVINESGTELDAENNGARFDGEQWVIDVVLSAMNRPGRLRDATRNPR